MRRNTARRLMTLGVTVLVLAGASAAYAAQPDRQPYEPDPTELGPGQACGFNVEIAQEPGSKYSQTVFDDGRIVTTGSGRDRVTALEVGGGSVSLPTSGKITLTELADGDLRLQASGRTVFYFWEGDQGPFGLVEEDSGGALYYIVGHVDEILAPDFTVTSFEWSGRATELCSLIAP